MNPLEALAARGGNWIGTNTLHDPNTGKPEESPSTLAITPLLGGRFARADYTWSYQDKPQEGSLLIGFEPKSGEVTGHWIDTWHMGHAVLACTGSARDAVIAIRGSYAAPPGPDWGWRIEIRPGDTLRITHTNIFPDGKEEPAVEAGYTRGATFHAAGPIGATDPLALPVKEIGPAVAFYTRCLGFSLAEKDQTTARLRRDEVEIGLAVNGRDPEQASCWFSVGDIDALWREYEARGIGPGPITRQEYDGKPHRAFFAREPYGVCFCFTQPL